MHHFREGQQVCGEIGSELGKASADRKDTWLADKIRSDIKCVHDIPMNRFVRVSMDSALPCR